MEVSVADERAREEVKDNSGGRLILWDQGGDSIHKICARVHAPVDARVHAGVCAPDSLSGTS